MSDGKDNAAFVHPHANVLGVNVSALNMDLAIELAEGWILTGEPAYICMTGVHGVMEAQRDARVREILNHALINAPDGMPMSWIGWQQGYLQMDRVYGPDFMSHLCRRSVARGYRHFLYGGRPGVAAALQSVLERRFPGLQIVGTYTPPFHSLSREQEKGLLQQVRQANPHIIWVGLSTPKQERFMAEYCCTLGVPLLVGVGAAFDFHTGHIHDAPSWIKRAGLQWLHRLMQEPKRLFGRYLINNPVFLWKVLLQVMELQFDVTASSVANDGPARQDHDNGTTLV